MGVTSWTRATDLPTACRELAEDEFDSKAIAGGTAVVLMMRQGLIAPESLVSLADLPELRGISESGDLVRIGASQTLSDVAGDSVVRRRFPSLAEACSLVGNPRIRNVATIGGNLAEADYASDPPAVLASLGARAAVTGPDGERHVDVVDLVTGYYETCLEPGEIITAVEIPVRTARQRTTYLKYRSRSSEDRACVGVAARVEVAGDGTVVDVEVVVAAVAGTLQRVPTALDDAVGRQFDRPTWQRLAEGYAEAITPIDDSRGSAWYRRRMIRLLVERALAGLDRGADGDRG